MMKMLFGSALLLALVGCATAPSTMDIPAVKSFDARRYMGDWCEIARIPGVHDVGVRDVTVHYELFGDGVIFVKRGFCDDRERVVTYRGPFESTRSVGEIRLKFLYEFGMLYRVLYVSDDYDVAIVTSEKKDALWFYAREKQIPEAEYDKLVKMAEGWGFDVSKLEKTPQGER